jgi:glycosyltransferase involved in cell wall biosynthesis
VNALLLSAGVALLLLSVAGGVQTLLGARRIRDLRSVLEESGRRESVSPAAGPDPPPLSVVITARDEAETIEASVRSFLGQRCPGLQVIAVDDRSSDDTGAILDRLATDPSTPPGRFAVLHLREIPPGWLGKTNACHAGAGLVRGEWILFTDGDVSLGDPDLLARVVGLAERERFDHVAVIPDLRPMGLLHAGLVSCFGQVFVVGARAHEMDRDRPRGGGGVGAFNLVRRQVYDRIGGHDLLRMEIIDDFKLGRLLKESGARQRLYHGFGLIRCPWHRGALRVVRGLEKNLFASLQFSLPAVVAFSVMGLAFALGPFLFGLLIQFGLRPRPHPLAVATGWLPFLMQAGFTLHAYRGEARRFGRSAPALALIYPLSCLLLLAAVLNSTVATLRRGGVKWRDTFYPLAALRRGVVRVGAGRRFRADG